MSINTTDNNGPSKNRRRRIFNNVMTVFNILLLLAAIGIAVMILTGCSGPKTFPEAESAVEKELEEMKNAPGTESLEALTDSSVAGEYDGAMLEGYVEKLKEFDYEILGSKKAEDADNGAIVTVRITTYDFGNEYLKAWNEHMELREDQRWQSQFYSFLLLRLSSVTNKDYVSDADVLCTQAEDGSWSANIKDNDELMNAISGGMLNEIKRLAAEGEVMDESEVNN